MNTITEPNRLSQAVTLELRRHATFSGGPVAAAKYLEDHPRASSKKFMGRPISSIYLDTTGCVHILKPHTHEPVARSVLRHTTTLAVPDESPDHDEWIQILLQTTGVIHGQILSDGIGVTMELTHAPTSEQIRAIRDLQLIRGDNFAAQVLQRGKPVADVGRFDQVVSAILSPRS